MHRKYNLGLKLLKFKIKRLKKIFECRPIKIKQLTFFKDQNPICLLSLKSKRKKQQSIEELPTENQSVEPMSRGRNVCLTSGQSEAAARVGVPALGHRQGNGSDNKTQPWGWHTTVNTRLTTHTGLYASPFNSTPLSRPDFHPAFSYVYICERHCKEGRPFFSL